MHIAYLTCAVKMCRTVWYIIIIRLINQISKTNRTNHSSNAYYKINRKVNKTNSDFCAVVVIRTTRPVHRVPYLIKQTIFFVPTLLWIMFIANSRNGHTIVLCHVCRRLTRVDFNGNTILLQYCTTVYNA